MYNYLRNSMRAAVDWLRATLLGHPPTDSSVTPISDDTNGARWRLVLAVAIPFWIYVTLARTVMFGLLFATNPGLIIAPPWIRGAQHLLLFPLLVVGYRAALSIGWPTRHRVRAVLGHLGLGLLFGLVARPVLVTLVATSTRDWSLFEELTHSQFGVPLSVDLWISTASDFFLSYCFGLGLIAGVHIFRELKHQKLRSAHLESAWIRARLQALRMQLNPHFLFNTLNAAVAVVHQRPAAAEQMLVRLADLLRRTLRDGESDQVTLEREIEFVRNYLEIQQLRFSDRLSFDVRVDPEVQRAFVPTLLLQPFAENAVIHGMTNDSDRVRVQLSARREGSALVIDIENNVGTVSSNSRGYGIGLGNTRERLTAMYGDRQSVEFFPPHDGVVRARVRIPYTPLAA
jgi:two-component system LytT family sensor kinase